jgi:hypothetical protein
MTNTPEHRALMAIQEANRDNGSLLVALLAKPDAEVQLGGAGVAGDLRRIYEIRHRIAASNGKDSEDWRRLVAVLRDREGGPAIRLVTARAGEERVLAVLDGLSLELLAELDIGG